MQKEKTVPIAKEVGKPDFFGSRICTNGSNSVDNKEDKWHLKL